MISFLILGLLLTSAVTAEETTTNETLTTAQVAFADNNGSTFITDVTATINPNVSIISTTGSMNISNSTATPTTKMADNENFTSVNATKAVTPGMPSTTTKPAVATEVTKPATEKDNEQKRTTLKPSPSSDDSTGIVIVVVIILVAVAFAVACYVARKRGRRYSVDFNSRPDDTNIPLSAVEPEMPADALPYNGKTVESAEVSANEKPEEKTEMVDEHKAEADKSVVDPSAESAAPPPDRVEDQPGVDATDQEPQEPSPPPPVEPGVEDKTDDEGAVSNKTSVESLKEANENNSNSADSSQKRDLKSSTVLWEVPLNCPL